MTEAAVRELLVLPPVADDPVFDEELTDAVEQPAHRLGTDPQDFAALFIRHRWSFALHARRFLSDQRDIDEVVQEGFLKLFLALPELDNELQALAYCRRTITNLCIDRYRADQRRPRLVDLETVPVHALPEDDADDPVVQAEDAAIIREALAMLSPLHREALIKREVEEKPLPQIAEELEIPVEQVKHVLHRARRSLRRLLVGTYVEPGVDLDLATVLAANRERAAAMAKPTGAAVVALILVIAGVLGLRPGSSSRPTIGAVPSSRSLNGLLDGPSPQHGVQPGAQVQVTAAPPAPQRGRLTTVIPRRSRAAGVPTSPKPAPAPTVPKEGPAGGSTTPPPVGVPVPVQPAAYRVSGVGGGGDATITEQQRALRPTGATSSSTISTTTATGTYALRQAFTFAPDGSLVDVTLNEAVPVPAGGAVGTLVDGSTSTVETLADGSVHVVTSGTAAPLAEVDGQRLAARDLTVDLVLAPDMVQVVTERVVVSEPSAVPAQSASELAPVAPTAPQPAAWQDPMSPLSDEGPATQTATVVVPVTRSR